MTNTSPRPSQHTTGVKPIYHQLRRTLRHGTHPAQLVVYSRPFIDLLAPADQHPGKPIEERAVIAEESLRAIVRRIGGTDAQALAIFLGLTPGYTKTTVTYRRKAAAQQLRIQPDTFRRPRHERMLLLQVAMEIYRKQRPLADTRKCA